MEIKISIASLPTGGGSRSACCVGTAIIFYWTLRFFWNRFSLPCNSRYLWRYPRWLSFPSYFSSRWQAIYLTLGRPAPALRRGHAQCHGQVCERISARSTVRLSVQSSQMAKRAKRYKDALHFGSYAFAAVLRGEDKIVRAIFENQGHVWYQQPEQKNRRHNATCSVLGCYYKTAKFLLENMQPSATDNQGNNAVHAVLEGWNYFFEHARKTERHGSSSAGQRFAWSRKNTEGTFWDLGRLQHFGQS